MSTDKRLVATYTVVHGTAEFVCAFTLFSWVRAWGLGLDTILVYSVVAFGFPLVMAVLGLNVLRNVPEGRIGLAGTVLMAAGVLMCQWGWACVVLLGLGSALFHIAAGTATLKQPRPGTSVGVFESLGAVGLSAGTILGAGVWNALTPTPWVYAGSVILIGGFFVLAWGTPAPGTVPVPVPSSTQLSTPFSTQRDWSLSGTGWIPLAVIAGLALVSVIRAVAGFTIPQPWKAGNGIVLVAAVFVALGRAVGGVIADKIGFVVPAIIGFVGAAILLIWPNSATAGLFGVFFLALPMAPVILALLRSTARPAISFGLAQFFQVPAAFASGILWGPWVVFATLLICAVVMFVCRPLERRENVSP